MTDHELAEALTFATVVEQQARAVAQLDERADALAIVRHMTGAQKALKDWIAARAVRAASHS